MGLSIGLDAANGFEEILYRDQRQNSKGLVKQSSRRSNLITQKSQLLPDLGQLFRKIPFLLTTAREDPKASLYGEKYLKRLLWYLFAGTRGGPNRAEIIKALQNRPSNANQLAQILRVDYKTIQHHVRVLEENGLIVPSDKGTYGAVLFLTPKMEEAIPILDEIWIRIGRRKINETNAGAE
jgi:DNA-binding transcriptional ArsR family regulator